MDSGLLTSELIIKRKPNRNRGPRIGKSDQDLVIKTGPKNGTGTKNKQE